MAGKRNRSLDERRAAMAAALRGVAERVGPDVTVARFYQETGITDRAIYQLFENWAALRVAAGLPAEVKRGRRTYSREGLLATLKETAAECGEDVSMNEFVSRTGVAAATVRRLFGSWTAFKESAGLTKARRPGPRPRFTREELLGHLRRLVDERGDVTLAAFCRELEISTQTLNRVGTWTELRRELKLPRRARTGRPKWQTELAGEIPDPSEEPDLTIDPEYAGLTIQDALRITEPEPPD